MKLMIMSILLASSFILSSCSTDKSSYFRDSDAYGEFCLSHLDDDRCIIARPFILLYIDTLTKKTYKYDSVCDIPKYSKLKSCEYYYTKQYKKDLDSFLGDCGNKKTNECIFIRNIAIDLGNLIR